MTEYLLPVFGSDGLNMMPAMAEVYAAAPSSTGVDFSTFCRLAHMHCISKYISVDQFFGLDRYYLEMLFERVAGWTMEPYNLAQIADPDIQRMRPYVELRTDDECCEQASVLKGGWLKHDELERLPLRDCWQKNCGCYYRTLSRGDLRREGRLPEGE